MHLSTSNSKVRIPDASYAKQWILSGSIAMILLVSAEVFWHSMGHLPSVTDDQFLWAYQRSKATKCQVGKAIVLLGSSRIQLGVVPEIMEGYFPLSCVVHLAVDGHPGFATFKDLAEDANFNGDIIFSTTAGGFFPKSRKAQESWVQNYHREWANWGRFEKIINMKIRVYLQSKLVMLHSSLNLRQLLFNGFRMPPPYISMLSNRYRPAFYLDRMSSERLYEHRRKRIARVTSRTVASTEAHEQEFIDIVKTEVAPLVQKLNARGGSVLFLRMPTCDEHWESDQIRHPKDLYWDKLHDQANAPTIHFRDVKALASYDCPDTSHLDAHDAVTFTHHLAQELLHRKFIASEAQLYP